MWNICHSSDGGGVVVVPLVNRVGQTTWCHGRRERGNDNRYLYLMCLLYVLYAFTSHSSGDKRAFIIQNFSVMCLSLFSVSRTPYHSLILSLYTPLLCLIMAESPLSSPQGWDRRSEFKQVLCHLVEKETGC